MFYANTFTNTNGAIMPKLLQALNAGDINIIDSLGCKINSVEEITNKVLNKLKNNITELIFNKNKKLKELENKELEKNNKKYIELSLNKIKEKLKKESIKYDSLKERISNVDLKECPICAQTVKQPSLTPCCKNIFCLKCVTYR